MPTRCLSFCPSFSSSFSFKFITFYYYRSAFSALFYLHNILSPLPYFLQTSENCKHVVIRVCMLWSRPASETVVPLWSVLGWWLWGVTINKEVSALLFEDEGWLCEKMTRRRVGFELKGTGVCVHMHMHIQVLWTTVFSQVLIQTIREISIDGF